MLNARIERKSSGIKPLDNLVKNLKNRGVYVGIPAAANKKGRKQKGINNAELLFIHTNGSQARGIPARPVLQPAINAEGNVEPIVRELMAATKAAARDDIQGVDAGLKRAGMAAQNAARKWFTDPRNGFTPNAPSTIKEKGSDRPLIDTGALRAAITYVVE